MATAKKILDRPYRDDSINSVNKMRLGTKSIHALEDYCRAILLESACKKQNYHRIDTTFYLILGRIMYGREKNAMKNNNGFDERHAKCQFLTLSCLLLFIRECNVFDAQIIGLYTQHIGFVRNFVDNNPSSNFSTFFNDHASLGETDLLSTPMPLISASLLEGVKRMVCFNKIKKAKKKSSRIIQNTFTRVSKITQN